jgi:hypothetical protein
MSHARWVLIALLLGGAAAPAFADDLIHPKEGAEPVPDPEDVREAMRHLVGKQVHFTALRGDKAGVVIGKVVAVNMQTFSLAQKHGTGEVPYQIVRSIPRRVH